eukprot:3483976-Heterocapsa_arctica.AAC.1
MNEHKRLEERPHRKGHSREVALNRPGMNNKMLGEHNGIIHNIGVQNERAGSEKKNKKEADWST